jgi:hypothetical protein
MLTSKSNRIFQRGFQYFPIAARQTCIMYVCCALLKANNIRHKVIIQNETSTIQTKLNGTDLQYDVQIVTTEITFCVDYRT